MDCNAALNIRHFIDKHYVLIRKAQIHEKMDIPPENISSFDLQMLLNNGLPFKSILQPMPVPINKQKQKKVTREVVLPPEDISFFDIRLHRQQGRTGKSLTMSAKNQKS